MRDYIDAAAFKEMILCADAALAANTQMINDLNVFPVPDGDTGTNMGLTMNKAATELRKKNFETIAAAADCVSSALLAMVLGRHTTQSCLPVFGCVLATAAATSCRMFVVQFLGGF